MSIQDDLVAKTMAELHQASKPASTSRVWKTPSGYKFLIQWSNLVLLRILIRKFTQNLPRSEYRAKAQVDDAARSNVANLEEGWKRATTAEYIRFLGFTQGSLEEVKGDVDRFLQDGFLPSKPGSSLADLGIDLKAWNLWAQDPKNSSRLLYFPLNSSEGRPRGIHRTLEDVKGNDLTYEIFIELINKSDWALRKLVQSLEHRLHKDRKFYQVEQIRLGRKLS